MLQSMGLERVRHDLMTEQQFIYLAVPGLSSFLLWSDLHMGVPGGLVIKHPPAKQQTQV